MKIFNDANNNNIAGLGSCVCWVKGIVVGGGGESMIVTKEEEDASSGSHIGVCLPNC